MQVAARRDGQVVVWDPSRESIFLEPESDRCFSYDLKFISSQKLNKSNNLCLLGDSAGNVHVLDPQLKDPLHVTFRASKQGSGVLAMQVDPTDSFLFTATEHGQVYVWDISQVLLHDRSLSNHSCIQLYCWQANIGSVNNLAYVSTTKLLVSSAEHDKKSLVLWTLDGRRVGHFGMDRWALEDIEATPSVAPAEQSEPCNNNLNAPGADGRDLGQFAAMVTRFSSRVEPRHGEKAEEVRTQPGRGQVAIDLASVHLDEHAANKRREVSVAVKIGDTTERETKKLVGSSEFFIDEKLLFFVESLDEVVEFSLLVEDKDTSMVVGHIKQSLSMLLSMSALSPVSMQLVPLHKAYKHKKLQLNVSVTFAPVASELSMPEPDTIADKIDGILRKPSLPSLPKLSLLKVSSSARFDAVPLATSRWMTHDFRHLAVHALSLSDSLKPSGAT